MALKAYVSVEKDVLLPAVLGLIVVAITVVTLYVLRRKKIAGSGQGGTEYVTSLDGQTVRRSTRSRKSVARWSPDDLASPTGYGTPKTPKPAEKEKESKTPISVKSVKKEIAEIANDVATPVVEAVVKRGPGRPPKTPRAPKTPAAAKTPAPTSPRRTRLRSGSTPAK
ncbi:hypothetical protein COCOBI_18-2480 [Coccomyxa sp. Obi]|nr:hypothetical protein COCOBI_18-2480 [Coccomyxa sp. Obi]